MEYSRCRWWRGQRLQEKLDLFALFRGQALVRLRRCRSLSAVKCDGIRNLFGAAVVQVRRRVAQAQSGGSAIELIGRASLSSAFEASDSSTVGPESPAACPMSCSRRSLPSTPSFGRWHRTTDTREQLASCSTRLLPVLRPQDARRAWVTRRHNVKESHVSRQVDPRSL